MQIKQGKRIPWEGEFLLPFRDINGQEYNRNIKILDIAGNGSSCICYDVLVENAQGDEHRRILKQFYPVPERFGIDVEARGTKIKIHGFEQEKKMKNLAKDFEQAYGIQRSLSNQEELMDIVVHPIEAYFQEETKYVLYEANYGYSMEKYQPKDAMEILKATYEILVALEKLHEKQILHMDLKPANILWIDQKRIKFFDFDASINMKEMQDISYIKGDEDLRLLAPELRKIKGSAYRIQDYLKPRVDVYAVAAMMFYWFLGRYPEAEDNYVFAAKEELIKILNEIYRGFFSDAEQEFLTDIIERGITDQYIGSRHRGKKGRYQTAKEMADDIKILMDAVQTGGKEEKGDYRNVNYRLITSLIMNENPLDPYRYLDDSGQYCLDVVLAGDSSIRDEFFKNVFSCAQMTDTTMKIRFLSKEAEQYWKVLELACPELIHTAEIYRNGKAVHEPLDQKIVETPLAQLYFYTEDEENICKYAEEWMNEQEQGPRYYIFAGNDYDKNYELVKILAQKYAEYEDKTLFAAFHDLRNDRNQLRKIESGLPEQKIQAFGGNERYSLEESNMKSAIGQLALGVHTFYTKGYWERATKEEISHDFRSSQYNVCSSIRAALGIRYKFVSCGLNPDGANCAERFYHRVLADCPGNEIRMKKLIALEHRRWTAFMILEGYQRPEWDQVKEYFYKGKNDYRDKLNKMHPCMWASKEMPEYQVKGLAKAEWKKQLEQLDKYDPLDQMSLIFHDLCDQKVKDLQVDQVFYGLKKEVEKCAGDKDLLTLYRWLRQTAERMIDDENNINHVWKEVCRVFQMKLQRMKQQVEHESLQQELQKIIQEMRIVQERNRYHDYKASHEYILRAIPRLLMGRPYRRIYKPFSSNNWENVMSTLILEPEELVILTEEDVTKELQQLEKFCRHRGLSTRIQQKKKEEIYAGKGAKRAILDITGLNPEELLEYQNHSKCASMDWCIYVNGKLKSYRGSIDVEFYEQKKTLSIEESLMLGNVHVDDHEAGITMLKLKEDYEVLWKAFCQIPVEEWSLFQEFLRRHRGWDISERGNEAKEQTWHIWKRMAQDVCLKELLQKCQEAGAINHYELEEEYEEYLLRVNSNNYKIFAALDEIFALSAREPYVHSYQLKKEEENLLIIEEGLYFHGTIEADMDAEALNHCMEILESGIMKDGRDRRIIEKTGKEFLMQQETGEVSAQFRYLSQPIQKILQTENGILKSYVYHKIWENAYFDDFKWNPSVEKEEKEGLDFVDLIGIKGNETVFISCVTQVPSNYHLAELAVCAMQYGINGKAVLVGSFPENAALKKKCRMKNIQYDSCK